MDGDAYSLLSAAHTRRKQSNGNAGNSAARKEVDALVRAATRIGVPLSDGFSAFAGCCSMAKEAGMGRVAWKGVVQARALVNTTSPLNRPLQPTSNKAGVYSLTSLPPEILSMILEFCTDASLLALALTCTKISQLASELLFKSHVTFLSTESCFMRHLIQLRKRYGWELYSTTRDQSNDKKLERLGFLEVSRQSEAIIPLLRCAEVSAALLCGWSMEPLQVVTDQLSLEILNNSVVLDSVLRKCEGRFGSRKWILEERRRVKVTREGVERDRLMARKTIVDAKNKEGRVVVANEVEGVARTV